MMNEVGKAVACWVSRHIDGSARIVVVKSTRTTIGKRSWDMTKAKGLGKGWEEIEAALVEHGLEVGVEHLDQCQAGQRDESVQRVWAARREQVLAKITIAKLKKL